jgi:hypothetical protein
MGINNWIFLKDGKPTLLHCPPIENGWLIDITATQNLWRTLKGAGLKYLPTQNLNQDPLENIFRAIHPYCGSNNHPIVGQFVDALKANIINGLAFRSLCGANCEDDGATVLDNLQSMFSSPDASSPNSSTSHGKETLDEVPKSVYAAQQIQVLLGVNCNACVGCRL